MFGWFRKKEPPPPVASRISAALAPFDESAALRKQLAERDDDCRKLGNHNRLLVDRDAMNRARIAELEEQIDKMIEDKRGRYDAEEFPLK